MYIHRRYCSYNEFKSIIGEKSEDELVMKYYDKNIDEGEIGVLFINIIKGTKNQLFNIN